MRALSLAQVQQAPLRSTASLPSQQARCLSQTILPSFSNRQSISPLVNGSSSQSNVTAEAGWKSGVAVFQKQQTRGMKVHSSIKKRCEHCKVSIDLDFVMELDWTR